MDNFILSASNASYIEDFPKQGQTSWIYLIVGEVDETVI